MKKEKENILIEVNGLKKYFPIKKGIFQQTVGQIKAVDNINFKIKSNRVRYSSHRWRACGDDTREYAATGSENQKHIN